VIGRCVGERIGAVVLDTGFGRRLVTEPDGELLPRIC
jgi:hydrogenase expression/formation protein HypE